MAIRSQTFAIITNRLIVKCWKKKINIPTKNEKNRTKPGNPYYLVLFEYRTKPGTVLSETVLSGDPLYYFFHHFLQNSLQKSFFFFNFFTSLQIQIIKSFLSDLSPSQQPTDCITYFHFQSIRRLVDEAINPATHHIEDCWILIVLV